MNILVTGGAGFIGSHLIDKLLTVENNKVYVVDNFDPFYSVKEKENNLKKYKGLLNFKLYKIDITDFKKINTIINRIKPDVVIHLAAKAGVRPSFEMAGEYMKTNVVGTINILESIKNIKISNFIFASSSSVYGENDRAPFVESDIDLHPISPYGVSKLIAEDIVRVYSDNYFIPSTVLRFFTVYGPRQRPDLAIRKFMGDIYNNKKITVFGDGSSMRDYTYVDDIVEGIFKCVNKPFKFEIINLGNSNPVLLNDLINNLQDLTDKKAIISFLPVSKGDVSKTFANVNKAKKLLGWSPTMKFKDGLKLMFDWYLK